MSSFQHFQQKICLELYFNLVFRMNNGQIIFGQYLDSPAIVSGILQCSSTINQQQKLLCMIFAAAQAQAASNIAITKAATKYLSMQPPQCAS